MDPKEEAQKKISETVQTLQEQRNSALDALVNTTVDLKLTASKLDRANARIKEVSANLEEARLNNARLQEHINVHNQNLSELQAKHTELLEAHEKLKAKTVPKVKAKS